MNNKGKINLIDIVIIIVALIAMIMIFPIGIIKDTTDSSSNPMVNALTESINGDTDAKQFFIPKYKKLLSIGVVPDDINSGVTIKVDLCTAAGELIASGETILNGRTNREAGYVNVPIKADVKVGELYYYRVYTESGDVILNYRSNEAGPDENSMLLYANQGIGDGANCLASRYVYRIPLKAYQWAFYYIFIIIIAIGVRELINAKKN